ncbi:MAG: DNA primase [Puniceicoccales bacterium]|jgi:DNA primase|nr:DNA primase [Puniceicoccales bacterium]
MITSDCIKKIKDSVDMCDVVSPYVTLKRCGANWRGLSPFNQEKTPSFFVMPAKRMFRCFSSGNAGDIFCFIQLKENVSFFEAVEIVAHRFNIALEFEKSTAKSSGGNARKTLFDLHELACDFFVKNFHGDGAMGERIRRYWTEKRKFTIDVARENGIGFGGDGGRVLVKKMLDGGFSADAMRASGIFYHRDGETDPLRFGLRFGGRLTIPIRDIHGRIVGFSARFVDGISPADSLADAKYINSPETGIFNKGSLLFGLHRARKSILPGGAFWMVEGQLDAIRCWDVGINTAIAPQGTAITDTQLGILRRYTAKLNCMLDGDSAGLKAAERMLQMAMGAGLDVKFFILPEGSDPDSYFREDFANRFQLLQESGMSAIEFLANRLLMGRKITAQEKADALARIYEVIAMAESSIARASYLDELAKVAHLDGYALAQDFNSFSTKRKFSNVTPLVQPNGTEPQRGKISSAEGQLLALILADEEIGRKVACFIDHPFLQNLSSNEGKILPKVLNEIRECMWEGISTLGGSQLFSEDEKILMYAALADFVDDCAHVDAVNACFRKLHSLFVKEQICEVNRDLQKIPASASAEVKNFQMRRMHLREMLKHPPQIFNS